MTSWTPKAELYDFGRPFPAHLVTALFAPMTQLQAGPGLRVFEPGCGTGRILKPLARAFPLWSFTGIDSSTESLDVCRMRCSEAGVTNVELYEGLLQERPPNTPFDLIVHSSVLHVVPAWRESMSLFCSCLTLNGIFCLVGDYGDIYNEALGRPARDGTDPALSKFWRRYIELRNLFGAPNAESSQVGCRWDLHSSDLASWLADHDFNELLVQEVHWNHTFTPSDLMRIVEERCYSSMFSIESEIFDQIVARLQSDLPSLELTPSITSRHQAVARFYQRAGISSTA